MKNLVIALILVCAAAVTAQAQSGFQVVVNESNGVSRMSTADAERMFMREQTKWSNGKTVVPLDLPAESATRERFSTAVLGRSTSQVKAHWQRAVFSGRGVPPAEQKSERELLAFVAANPGAIGYVNAGTTLPAGVRSLPLSGAKAGGDEEVFDAARVERAPQLISQPPARYPQRLLSEAVEGTVTVQFVVNTRGRVESESVVVLNSSQSAFEAPAMEVVKRSVFRPAQFSGRSVPVRVRQAIKFSVKGS